MEDSSRQPVDAILLADGLTNLRGRSGEAWINSAAEQLGFRTSWTRYEPHSYDGHIVETTAVFPHIFGLTPARNPGRAGLELYLDGELHDGCGHFAVMQGSNLAEYISSLSSNTSIHVRPSAYSPSRNTWLVCSPKRTVRDEVLDEARASVPQVRIGHVVSPTDGWLVATQNADLAGRRHFLIGWCHGALLSAFKLCGVVTTRHVHSEASPDKTRVRRMTELGEQLHRYQPPWIRPIVYLKDPAWDARRSNSKDAAFRFTVSVLKRILEHPTIESVLVMSDHNSEAGIDETRAGQTLVGIAAKRANATDRWEDQFRSRSALTQAELVEELDAAWL